MQTLVSADMESIDALAKAINEWEGGMVLVSHDMRLIGQVAKEIWICDHKTITLHKGDISSFKMDMRRQMGLDGDQAVKLRGDASVKQQSKEEAPKKKPVTSKLEVIKANKSSGGKSGSGDDAATTTTVGTSSSMESANRYVPPHLRRKGSNT